MQDADMTETGARDAAALHVDIVRVMRSGMTAADAAEAASRALGRAPTERLDVDTRELSVTVPVDSVPSLLPLLHAAARDGHQVILRCEQPDATLTSTWTSTGRASLDIEGSARDLVATEHAAALEAAVTRGDADAALALLTHVECDIEIVARAPDDLGHWVPSTGWLAERLAGATWASTLLRLKGSSPDAP